MFESLISKSGSFRYLGSSNFFSLLTWLIEMFRSMLWLEIGLSLSLIFIDVRTLEELSALLISWCTYWTSRVLWRLSCILGFGKLYFFVIAWFLSGDCCLIDGKYSLLLIPGSTNLGVLFYYADSALGLVPWLSSAVETRSELRWLGPIDCLTGFCPWDGFVSPVGQTRSFCELFLINSFRLSCSNWSRLLWSASRIRRIWSGVASVAVYFYCLFSSSTSCEIDFFWGRFWPVFFLWM